MRLPRSRVRWRLTLWYAASLVLVFLVFSTCVFFYVRASGMYLLRAQVDQEFALVERAVAATPDAALDDGLRALDPTVRAFIVTDTSGHTLHASPGWQAARLDDGTADGHGIQAASSGRHHYVASAEVRHSGRRLRIAVADDIEQAYQGWRKLALVLLVGLPCALCVSLVGGWVLAGRALAPIEAMARKAREITADKLSERLPVHDPDDEFGHLATVFNDTLERLDAAFQRLRRFTADASHELRTPLTVIRSIGENALQRPQDAAAHADTLGSIMEETDRLVALVDGLLVLTRAEAGQFPLQPVALDLAELAADVVGCLQVLAEDKAQRLSVDAEPGVTVTADRSAVRLALFNLVANAVRYTPDGGGIDVRVRRLSTGHGAIEVQDDGPGIAAEHLPRVFERFYRVDPDRSRDTGGAGLGLAIAKWAVELNGGTLGATSVPNEGSVFRLSLPLSADHRPE